MLATSSQLEVLDLRHFSAPALRPLLEQEAARWQERLLWDYSKSIELLLGFVDSRSLTGYTALRQGRVVGYAFGVCEANKAVVGDLYAFGEADPERNPVSELLLQHLMETLQATPGIQRVESQLLLFPQRALTTVFAAQGFQPYPRCFMVLALEPTGGPEQPGAPRPLSTSAERRFPAAYHAERWGPQAYAGAAALIRDVYAGHTDANINDQYRSTQGALRFLHNIVNFPGCGTFDAAHSWLLYDAETGALGGMALCSRVRADAAHITQFCIRPGLQGHGLGTALLRHCLDQLRTSGLRTVSLTVTQSNLGALRLYQREGFRHWHNFNAWVWDK